MRRLTAAHLTAMLLLAGCAQPGAPPGGPEDTTPPKLVSVSPDSGSVNVKGKAVEFQFDEVVSEKPAGGARSLDELFLISPLNGATRVRWHRSRLSVEPTRGWRGNTAYTVTMLPGLSDLRGNKDTLGRTIVFSTGATIPNAKLQGIVFDWITAKPAPKAFIEAIALSDSARYVTMADTAAHFVLSHLPPGKYTLRAIIDQNNNRALDPREAFDSATVTLTDSLRREMLAFVHDSIGPGISTVTIADSITLRVQLDRPLDTAIVVRPSLFVVKSADSSTVPIASAASLTQFEKAKEDSLRRVAVADSLKRVAQQDSVRRADSLRAAGAPQRPAPRQPVLAAPPPLAPRDTTKRLPPPTPSAPSPTTEVVIRLETPLRPGTSYRVHAIELRNLLGNPRTSDRVFTTPKAAPADTTRTPRDSSRARQDTTRARRDTSRVRP